MQYEIIGLSATLLILISFLFNDAKKIRVMNGIGGAVFIIYGVLIHSYSNIILNAALIIIHTVKLRRIIAEEKAEKIKES